MPELKRYVIIRFTSLMDTEAMGSAEEYLNENAHIYRPISMQTHIGVGHHVTLLLERRDQ